MSNGYGSLRVNLWDGMCSHDRCPAGLRWAVCNAVGKYGSQNVLDAWRNGMSEQTIAAAIRRGDRSETLNAYGPTHPEAMQ